MPSATPPGEDETLGDREQSQGPKLLAVPSRKCEQATVRYGKAEWGENSSLRSETVHIKHLL